MQWIRWWERKPRAIYVHVSGELRKVKISTPKWDTESQAYRVEATWDLVLARAGERLIFRDGTVYEILQAQPRACACDTTILVLTKNA